LISFSVKVNKYTSDKESDITLSFFSILMNHTEHLDEKNPHFIELIDVKKTYGGSDMEPVYALRGVSLTIDDGDFISIMGPSGCGKSTLMNIVGLLDTPTSGDYLLRGKKVEAMSQDDWSLIRRSTIGFVFQGYNLLKRMPAREQVALPL
jgi:putative ABC transport system ATP-binding protein